MTFRPLDTHVPLSAFNYVHLSLRSGCCKTSLCSVTCDVASGKRIDALILRLFKPRYAVAFSSFRTNFTFFSIKDCDKFSPETQKMRISAVKCIYCNSCVSRTLRCNACSRHDVTLRRGKCQKTHYHTYQNLKWHENEHGCQGLLFKQPVPN